MALPVSTEPVKETIDTNGSEQQEHLETSKVTTAPIANPVQAQKNVNDAVSIPEPPLNSTEKIVAGVMIIGAIFLSLYLIIGYWPDKMPTATSSTYRYEPMHVTLIDSISPEAVKAEFKPKPFASKELDLQKREVDSLKEILAEKDAFDKIEKGKANPNIKIAPKWTGETIQFGALILILVASSGFLGNMVYLASSFGAFVGSGKFKRSWTLWYFLKPFTASGLAAFLYLALNNSNSVSGTLGAPINLNGILAAAALAGLFTDIATQKLKEIFTAIFKPADNRPDKISDQSPKAASIDLNSMHPDKIDPNSMNQFLIAGQNLDPKNIVVMILKQTIDPIVVSPTSIKFSYTVSNDNKGLSKFPLLITDIKGIKIAEKVMDVL